MNKYINTLVQRSQDVGGGLSQAFLGRAETRRVKNVWPLREGY